MSRNKKRKYRMYNKIMRQKELAAIKTMRQLICAELLSSSPERQYPRQPSRLTR